MPSEELKNLSIKYAKDFNSIDANKLVQEPTKVTVPQPLTPSFPSNSTVGAVSSDIGKIITAQTDEAKRLRTLRDEQALFGELPTLSSMYQDQLNQYGIPKNMKELKDIQLQLSDMNTASDLQKSQIAGAKGQTLGQGQRELTQQDIENSIRQRGLAARASVIQGNIETATALAGEATTLAFQDRSLRNQNLINQINSLQGVVDDQTAQLLEQDRRKYEEDQTRIEDLKTAVQGAILAGASQQEIAQLTSAGGSDEQKLALAQSIQARTVAEDRSLDRALRYEQLRKAREASTEVIDRGDGTKQLINKQTGDVIATYGTGDLEGVEPYTPEQESVEQSNVNDIANLASHDGLNAAVGPNPLARWNITDLGGAKEAFVGKVENMVKNLTLMSYAEAKEQGMTFGAMSNAEWQILGQAATAISQWRVHEDDDPNKKVVGYDVDEKTFKSELDKLTQFAKLGFVNKGGNPTSVGVQVMEDGTFWTLNSDGTLTNIR